MKLSPKHIGERVEAHGRWLRNEPGGQRFYLDEDETLVGANLIRADLSRTNLSRTNLSRTNLSRTNLSLADLSLADLSWAILGLANLSLAYLSRTNLFGADLYRTNLFGADLCGANLSRADLSATNLRGVRLVGAIGNGRQICSFQGKHPIVWTSDVLAIGCQQHPLSWWREATDEELSLALDDDDADEFLEHKSAIFAMIDASPATGVALETKQ